MATKVREQPLTAPDLVLEPDITEAWANLVQAIELRTGRENPLRAWELAYETAFMLYHYEIRKAEYKHYLSTNKWERTREAALGRADNRCQLCSSQYNLNVHHRTYQRLGSERDGDLIVLCTSCHSTFHDRLAVGGDA